MSLVVAGLLVVILGGLGALVAVPALHPRWWLPLAAVFVLAGVLFVPVRCATGIPASPVHDVRDQPRPTSCESVTGIELPELGMFASDTVGWGLALGAFCLSLGASVVTAGRMLRSGRRR